MNKWILVLSFIFPICVYAQTSGNCGPKDNDGNFTSNCTYTYDTDTRTLTISGTGKMADVGCTYDEQNHCIGNTPWKEYISQINNIVVEEGITSIGVHAFKWTSANNVSLPSSLENIGMAAFQYASALTNITLPSHLEHIGHAAFNSTSIAYFTLPESFQKYENYENQNTYLFSNSHLRGITIEGQADFVKDMLMGMDTSNVTIYCNKINPHCEELKNDADIGDKIKFYEYKNGIYFYDGKIYDNPADIAVNKSAKRRIYTIEEANFVAGDKNRVSIKYR